MNKDKRTAIYSTLRELMPSPTTELEYANPFELLIAVILSAQATDISVNKATAKLYPVANTPEAILALGVAGLTAVHSDDRPFQQQSQEHHQDLRILIEQHGSEVPRSREELEALARRRKKDSKCDLEHGVW